MLYVRSFGIFAVVATAAVAVTSIAAVPVHAQTFGFEGQVATNSSGDGPGGYTTLTETQGGVVLTLMREGATRFDVTNFSGVLPASFGARTLDPFFNSGNSAFIGNFSTTLSGVSIQFGDAGQDTDVFTLQAFSGLNGTGTLLGSTSVNYPGSQSIVNGAFGVGSLSGLSGIQSIRFIGGSSGGFENSVYYDNITITQQGVTAVPEPSEWAVIGMTATTLGGLMVRARRRKSVVAA